MNFCVSRECWLILQHREWSNAQHKSDFESGVRVGVGTFNLLISLLPGRIMRLLEFIGFTAAKVHDQITWNPHISVLLV